MEQETLYALAIHQAGHTVAAFRLGVGTYIRSVSLPTHSFPLGRIEYNSFSWPNQHKQVSGKALRSVTGRIVARLSGPVAEAKQMGCVEEQASEEDYEEADKRAWQYSLIPGEWYRLLHRQAEELFTFQGKDTLQWTKVIRIANTLMEKKQLSREELTELYHQ